MADANETLVRYLREVTYNTTPIDDAGWKLCEFTAEQFTATPRTVQSQEIRTDRSISDQFVTGLDVAGGFDFELSEDAFDDFLESVFHNAWSTDTLTIGTSDFSYSFEKEFQLAATQYQTYTGMRSNGMTLNFEFGQLVTGNFSFMGAGSATSATSAVGSGSTAALTTTTPFNASSEFGSLEIDDVASSICIQSLTLTVNNNMRSIECLGNAAPADQRKGTALVTVDINAYLDADSWAEYENALSQTSIDLEWSITKGGAAYSFDVPNLKWSGESPQATGLDTDVFVSLSGTALYDTGTSTSITIVRTT
jgi:hypothetical protein